MHTISNDEIQRSLRWNILLFLTNIHALYTSSGMVFELNETPVVECLLENIFKQTTSIPKVISCYCVNCVLCFYLSPFLHLIKFFNFINPIPTLRLYFPLTYYFPAFRSVLVSATEWIHFCCVVLLVLTDCVCMFVCLLVFVQCSLLSVN